MPPSAFRQNFDSDTLALMVRAYEQAVDELGLPRTDGDDPAAPQRQVARRIILAAQKGERRPEVLVTVGTQRLRVVDGD
jgi:hypothetical protein